METKTKLTVGILREMFRHLEAFRLAYQDHNLDTITWDGVSYSLWDMEALYRASQTLLSTQQARAIKLFLVDGMFEADAAEMMQVSRSNPVGMYATDGIKRLILLVESRLVPGYRNG